MSDTGEGQWKMYRFRERCEWQSGCHEYATYEVQWITPEQVSYLRAQRFCKAHAERRLKELNGEGQA